MHLIFLQPVKFIVVFQKGDTSNVAVFASRGNLCVTVLDICFVPIPGVGSVANVEFYWRVRGSRVCVVCVRAGGAATEKADPIFRPKFELRLWMIIIDVALDLGHVWCCATVGIWYLSARMFARYASTWCCRPV